MRRACGSDTGVMDDVTLALPVGSVLLRRATCNDLSAILELQLEAVRVRADQRSRGIGAAMMRWAMDAAPGLGATLVQLISDAARGDAHRFYERLGFTASHVGFKFSVPA